MPSTLFLFLFAFATAVACADLPDLGHGEGALSPLEEQALGDELAQQALRQLPLLHDAELSEYINDLGHKILSHFPPSPYDFHFYLVDTPQINAFAAPGGHVYFYSGLVLAARTESELAGVVAHEIAHVSQRHISRSIAKTERLQWPMLLGALAGAVIGGPAGATLITGSAAVGLQEQLRFSREFEHEADRVGIQALHASGFSPYGMVRFFEVLERMAQIQGEAPFEFLTTHPFSDKRRAEALQRAEFLVGEEKSEPPNQNFLNMQAKLRVFSTPKSQAQNIFLEAMKSPSPAIRDAASYGTALLKNHDQCQQALQLSEPLAHAHPDERAYLLALGQGKQFCQRYEEAVSIYLGWLNLRPDDRVVQESLASAYLEMGDTDKASKIVLDLISAAPKISRYRKLHASCLEKSGRHAESHYALAHYYYFNGDMHSAMKQLRIAQSLNGNDIYLLSAIKARETEWARQRTKDK